MVEKQKGRELVKIEHANVKGDPATVTRDAYNKVWKGRGWRLATGKGK